MLKKLPRSGVCVHCQRHGAPQSCARCGLMDHRLQKMMYQGYDSLICPYCVADINSGTSTHRFINSRLFRSRPLRLPKSKKIPQCGISVIERNLLKKLTILPIIKHDIEYDYFNGDDLKKIEVVCNDPDIASNKDRQFMINLMDFLTTTGRMSVLQKRNVHRLLDKYKANISFVIKSQT